MSRPESVRRRTARNANSRASAAIEVPGRGAVGCLVAGSAEIPKEPNLPRRLAKVAKRIAENTSLLTKRITPPGPRASEPSLPMFCAGRGLRTCQRESCGDSGLPTFVATSGPWNSLRGHLRSRCDPAGTYLVGRGQSARCLGRLASAELDQAGRKGPREGDVTWSWRPSSAWAPC